MDTTTIAKLGFTPLAAEFARIAAITNRQGLADVIARLQYIGVGPAYGLFIGQDEKKSDRYVVHLYQGGLGLPDRDYYFDTDDRAKMLRGEYVLHVAKMFRLLGDDSTRAAANAATVMSLETELAGASRKLADLRDPIANYNAMSLAGVGALTPAIKWREHLAAGNIRSVDSVVVGQPEFFKQLETSIEKRGLDDWKTYLRWQLATSFASQAGGAFDAEHFHFFGTILNGTPEQRPRWKRTLDAEESYTSATRSASSTSRNTSRQRQRCAMRS